MNFELDETQTLIRNSVARFLNDAYAFPERQQIVATESGYLEEHWQHSKNTPEMAASIRVLQNSTSSTRRMPDLCGSFGRGFWRAKPKRSGDPCEVGSSRRIFG